MNRLSVLACKNRHVVPCCFILFILVILFMGIFSYLKVKYQNKNMNKSIITELFITGSDPNFQLYGNC